MCGIIGGIGSQIGRGVLKGLQRLEYRGYDSFGLSLIAECAQSHLVKRVGAPSHYSYDDFQITEHMVAGIGHTRWATHGGVCESNAHPHEHQSRLGRLSVVHNGVVENVTALYQSLLPEYQQRLLSQTDTELLLMHIVQRVDRPQYGIAEALQSVFEEVDGSFAFLLLEHDSQTIWALKQDLPLLYVPGATQSWLLSDLHALESVPEQAHLLMDRCLFHVCAQGGARYYQPQTLSFFTPKKEAVQEQQISAEGPLLLSEIREQPEALARLLQNTVSSFPQAPQECHFIGCGSSYHAGLIAAQLLEPLLQCPIRVFIASEFRAYPPATSGKAVLVALSQSGETADILAALREQGSSYAHKIGVCNREGSMLERLVDHCYYLGVGAERSVASTKAFTAQILCLWQIFSNQRTQHLAEIWQPPAIEVIATNIWQDWAKKLSNFSALMILGRGPLWAVAQEGALKMKELTYRHVHALPSSELKHGSLALIDEHCPVMLLLPKDHLLKKNLLTLHEIAARGGPLFVIAEEGISVSEIPAQAEVAFIASLPQVLQPLLFTIPLQLLSAYWAQQCGWDLDKPRNLAKSVTVE